MSSRFYFGDEDNSSNGSDTDLDSLPYPKPLKRSDFLVPNFSPTEYLSTLQNRHQTLEDLRAELRTRSQDLNKELLDLVNHNYQDFLGLGSSLKGGDEKIEEVRFGLLGFKRELEGLKTKVADRRQEVQGLLSERKALREKIHTGRQLLELDKRIGELEQRLLLNTESKTQGKGRRQHGDGAGGSEDDSGSDSEESIEEETHVPILRLRRRVEQYMLVKKLAEKLGVEQPFVAKQENRILKIRRTLLLDMSSALRSVVGSRDDRRKDHLFMLETYGMMDERNEAMKILKEVKNSKT